MISSNKLIILVVVVYLLISGQWGSGYNILVLIQNWTSFFLHILVRITWWEEIKGRRMSKKRIKQVFVDFLKEWEKWQKKWDKSLSFCCWLQLLCDVWNIFGYRMFFITEKKPHLGGSTVQRTSNSSIYDNIFSYATANFISCNVSQLKFIILSLNVLN